MLHYLELAALNARAQALLVVHVAERFEAQHHTTRWLPSLKPLLTGNFFNYGISFVVFVNFVAIFGALAQGTLSSSACTCDADGWAVVNDLTSGVFVAEFILKHVFLGLRGYWASPLNCIDGALVVLIVIEIIVDMSVDGSDTASTAFGLLKAFRFLRLLRAARVIKAALPRLSQVANKLLFDSFYFGYDVTVAYLHAHEEIMEERSHGAALSLDPEVDAQVELMLEANIRSATLALAHMKLDWPQMCLAISTFKAARVLLNACKARVIQIRHHGGLAESEAERLLALIDRRDMQLDSLPPHAAIGMEVGPAQSEHYRASVSEELRAVSSELHHGASCADHAVHAVTHTAVSEVHAVEHRLRQVAKATHLTSFVPRKTLKQGSLREEEVLAAWRSARPMSETAAERFSSRLRQSQSNRTLKVSSVVPEEQEEDDAVVLGKGGGDEAATYVEPLAKPVELSVEEVARE